MLKFGNKEFRNIQEQVEKNAKDIEKLIEEGVPGGGGSGESGLPTDKPTANGQILVGNTNGTVEWTTETIHEFVNEGEFEELVRATPTSVSIIEDQGKLELMLEHDGSVLDINETPNTFLQKKLVSGSNIKTINGVSILGSGDIQVGEGGTVDLGDYYTKEQSDNKFATRASLDTTDEDVIALDNRVTALENSGGSGGGSGNHIVELPSTVLSSAYSSSNPYTLDSAIIEKLKDLNSVIWIKSQNYMLHLQEVIPSETYTDHVYRSDLECRINDNEGKIGFNYAKVTVRISTATTPAKKQGAWGFTSGDYINFAPQLVGNDYTDDGDYIWVATKGNSYISGEGRWEKYTPGTGGSAEGDLSNYYTKTQVDSKFATRTSLDSTDEDVAALDVRVTTLESNSGGTADLSNYYTKTQADNQFAAKTTFDTTVMGINNVLDDIPTTYATNAGVATLEANVMREISSLDTRVDALEAGGGSGTGGNFTPQGSVTDNGQFLVGNTDGTYEWSTQTLPEIYNATEEAKTTANEAKSITVGFSENLSSLRISLDSTDEDVANLDTRVTALENIGNAEEGSY